MSKRDFLKVGKNKLKIIEGVKNDEMGNKDKELSLPHLQKLYNEDGGFNYTNEQLLEIKKFIERMAEIAIECYKRMKRNNIIKITDTENDNETESDTLCKSKHRRTG